MNRYTYYTKKKKIIKPIYKKNMNHQTYIAQKKKKKEHQQ